MDFNEVLETIQGFLEEAEDEGVTDFIVDDNFDSITIISLEGE